MTSRPPIPAHPRLGIRLAYRLQRALRPRPLKDIGRVPLFVVSHPGEEHPRWRGRSRPVAPAREVIRAVLSEVARRQAERRDAATADGESAD